MTNDMEMAKFFVDCCGQPPAVWQAEFGRRFPNASREQVRHAVDVAQEILRADGDEYYAKAEALRAEGNRRKS